MNFKLHTRYDDFLFVIALLLPCVFAGARYLESNREVVQVAQAQSRHAVVAHEQQGSAQVRVARADNPRR